MKKTRARYEPWLRDYLRKRYPELEPPLLAAIDAFDTILDENRIDATLMAPVIEAASSSRRPLYENATPLLGELAASHAIALDSVGRMASDPRSHVRFNAILCLTKATPLEFRLDLLRQGLRDKSAKVRGKAADWAGRLRLRDLVPDLEAAFASEKNAKAKQTIEFDLRLLRDGHILKPAVDDGYYLLNAFSSRGVVSKRISRSELDERGIAAIVAEIASL